MRNLSKVALKTQPPTTHNNGTSMEIAAFLSDTKQSNCEDVKLAVRHSDCIPGSIGRGLGWSSPAASESEK